MKSNLKNRFGQQVKQKNLLRLSDRILVAVSGGLDSVVLLHLLLRWRRRFRLEVAIIHLNHQIRGAAADSDAEFVRELAEASQLTAYILSEDIPRFAAENKYSLEEAGHLRRGQIFEELAARENFDKIATGHHLDDQAETLLMRLIVGTGIGGLAGIRNKSGLWVRPLLFAARREIFEYASENKLAFREDATNRDPGFERNKIRHELLPLITSEYNAQASAHLANLSSVFAEWDIFQKERLRGELEAGKIHLSPKKISVEISAFLGYFSWFKMYLIQHIIKTLKIETVSLGFNKLEAFGIWLEGPPGGGEFNWGGKFISRLENGKIFFMAREKIEADQPLELLPGIETPLNDGGSILLEPVERAEAKFGVPGVEYLCGDNLRFPLLLRRWQKGDRFQPLGLRGKKLISDF